jgi:hypothetical protein
MRRSWRKEIATFFMLLSYYTYSSILKIEATYPFET